MEPNKELEKVIEKKFLTPQKFAIEIESVTKLVSKPLKEKLKYDAQELNFMKKTSRAKLPL